MAVPYDNDKQIIRRLDMNNTDPGVSGVSLNYYSSSRFNDVDAVISDLCAVGLYICAVLAAKSTARYCGKSKRDYGRLSGGPP